MTMRERNVRTALMCLASFALAFFFAVVPVGTTAATDGSIAGMVTDDAGKPLRGATVTAAVDNMSVSRFSDATGKYRIEGLKPGNYNISATAYGFEVKSVPKEIGSGPSDLAFSLKARWNPSTISSAEYISAYGNDKDVHNIEGNCTGCHNFSWIMRRRGQTAAEWESFIPQMSPRQLFVTPRFSPDELKDISVSLEKVFGPDSPLPTKEQVRHVDISDEALNSTFRMYTPPTKNIAHSLVVAPNGLVWFTEHDNYSNKITSFDPRTSEFQEYPIPTPKSGDHNPWVARNGMIWVSENAAHKLAMLDPQTGKITEYIPPDGSGTHTLREDLQGNIWASGGKMTKFDIQTKKFTVYDTPSTYDIAVDAHNNVWGASSSNARSKGMLARIDAKTGDLKVYPVPGATFMRGIEGDNQDNIWFGDVTEPQARQVQREDRADDVLPAADAGLQHLRNRHRQEDRENLDGGLSGRECDPIRPGHWEIHGIPVPIADSDDPVFRRRRSRPDLVHGLRERPHRSPRHGGIEIVIGRPALEMICKSVSTAQYIFLA